MRYYPSLFTDDLSAVGNDLREIAKILNGEISINENIKGGLIEATLFGEETTIYHGLGYVPMGFIVINKSGSADIWGARVSDWTSENLFLGSNVESVEVRLFVM
jgi:hypothetical protein